MNVPDLLAAWGLPLVFGSVLAEQSGLPVPAAPLLVGAGALAADGQLRPELLLLLAIAACLLADHVWFLLGRRHGRRMLAFACRISLSPDTCVSNADRLIARHGAMLLVVAKFIPGVSALAIPTAAAQGLGYRRFLLHDAAGAALWSGAYIAAGMIFSHEVNLLLAAMERIGSLALVLLAALLAAWFGWKLFGRYRLKRLHRLVRISPHELRSLLEAAPSGLVVVDARSRDARLADPRRLPRSVALDGRPPHEVLPQEVHAGAATIVTFCTCPNEASAALVAKRLLDAGFGRVRVLTGGDDALALLAEAEAPASG